MRLLHSLISGFRLRRWSGIRSRYAEWSREAGAMADKLARRKRQLEATERRLVSIGTSLREDVDECQLLLKKHQNAVDELNSELEILKEVTVPGLTSAHQLLLQRMDADTSIQVRRQVAAMPSKEE